ncbi:hypothetical protein [Nocardioides sp. LML1-1-1.1]|uniref:hypothetical protein n=1 Tax=Nocardioides sp. LML1-1-1.1 TaxID=3135248 RepID=UPI00341C95B8
MTPTLPRALAAAALAAAVVATAVPASATNPYKPGGGPSLRLVADSPGVTFSTVSISTTCTTFTLAGVVENPGTARAHSVRAGYLSTLTSGGCGTTTITPTGSWNVVVPGDPTGTVWPMRLTNAAAQAASPGCTFSISGTVVGTFDTATQKFTATSSTLTTSNVTGVMCPIIDVLPGDDVAVAGTWTNSPPTGSGPLTLGH